MKSVSGTTNRYRETPLTFPKNGSLPAPSSTTEGPAKGREPREPFIECYEKRGTFESEFKLFEHKLEHLRSLDGSGRDLDPTPGEVKSHTQGALRNTEVLKKTAFGFSMQVAGSVALVTPSPFSGIGYRQATVGQDNVLVPTLTRYDVNEQEGTVTVNRSRRGGNPDFVESYDEETKRALLGSESFTLDLNKRILAKTEPPKQEWLLVP